MPTIASSSVFSTAAGAYGVYITGSTSQDYLATAATVYADFSNATSYWTADWSQYCQECGSVDDAMQSCLTQDSDIDLSVLADNGFFDSLRAFALQCITLNKMAEGYNSSTEYITRNVILYNGHSLNYVCEPMVKKLWGNNIIKFPIWITGPEGTFYYGYKQDSSAFMSQLPTISADSFYGSGGQIIEVSGNFTFGAIVGSSVFMDGSDNASSNVHNLNGYQFSKTDEPFIFKFGSYPVHHAIDFETVNQQGYLVHFAEDVPFWFVTNTQLICTLSNGEVTYTDFGIAANATNSVRFQPMYLATVTPDVVDGTKSAPANTIQLFLPTASQLANGYTENTVIGSEEVTGRILTLENMLPGLKRYDASFADVAKTGDYDDLINKPTLGTAASATVETTGISSDTNTLPTTAQVKSYVDSISPGPSSSLNSVSFNANGGNGIMNEIVYKHGVIAPECDYEKTGWHFDSWNTAADGSGTNYAPGDVITSSTDITLYALWSYAYGVYASNTLTLFRSRNTYTAGSGQTVTDVDGNSYTGKVYVNIEDQTANNPGWYDNEASSIKYVAIPSGQTISPKNCRGWFEGTDLRAFDLPDLDTSNVVNMSHMFSDCTHLASINLSNFNTSKVTNMGYMFYNCQAVSSLDVSSFDTSNVTDMRNMFNQCSAITSLNISTFDTRKVTDMYYMFSNCEHLATINMSNCDTSNVVNMDNMFSYCSALKNIYFGNQFNTKNVETMYYMFYGCAFTSLTLPLLFNTEKVKNMDSMFGNCSSLTSLTFSSSFNTRQVTTMKSMFYMCSSLTSINLEKFRTGNVTDMSGMFRGCSGVTSLDLSKFDFSEVTKIANMFNGCSALTTIYAKADTDLSYIPTTYNVGQSVFSSCSRLVGGNNTAYSSSHVNSDYARIDNLGNNPGYFTAK